MISAGSKVSGGPRGARVSEKRGERVLAPLPRAQTSSLFLSLLQAVAAATFSAIPAKLLKTRPFATFLLFSSGYRFKFSKFSGLLCGNDGDTDALGERPAQEPKR